MRQSHVDLRSRRYAPRQYVAETHDHKPDAPTHRTPGNETVAPIEQEQPT